MPEALIMILSKTNILNNKVKSILNSIGGPATYQLGLNKNQTYACISNPSGSPALNGGQRSAMQSKYYSTFPSPTPHSNKSGQGRFNIAPIHQDVAFATYLPKGLAAEGSQRGGYATSLNKKVENLTLPLLSSTSKEDRADTASPLNLSGAQSKPSNLNDTGFPLFRGAHSIVANNQFTNLSPLLSRRGVDVGAEIFRNYILSTKLNLTNAGGTNLKGPIASIVEAQVAPISPLLLNNKEGGVSVNEDSTLLPIEYAGLIKSNKDNPLPSVAVGGKHMSLNSFKESLNKLTGFINSPYKIRHYLNLFTKLDFEFSNFQFKKTNKYLFTMEKAANFLKLAFLSKGCLISKPTFNVVYTLNRLDKDTSLNSDPLMIAQANNSNAGGTNIVIDPQPSKDEGEGGGVKAKIIIHLFYYVKTKAGGTKASLFVQNTSNKTVGVALASALYNDKFLFLSDYLTKLFNTEVELELVRLYQPYQNSDILSQHLNIESYNKKFLSLIFRLFKKINTYKKNKFISANFKTPVLNQVSYPSGISGVNIKLAGRSINERIRPRMTVKRAQRGNFNRLNAKMIEKSMFTDKSKKGAFNFTVTLSHIFR